MLSDSAEKEKTISLRIEESLLDEFDELLFKESPGKVESRSRKIRGILREYVEKKRRLARSGSSDNR